MAKTNPIIEQPWQTEVGTIQVGDPVVAVTVGYNHRISILPGKYLGYIEGKKSWHDKTGRKVKVEVESERYTFVIKGTDKRCSWNHPNKEYKKIKFIRKTTLKLNRVFPLQMNDQTIQLLANINKVI